MKLKFQIVMLAALATLASGDSILAQDALPRVLTLQQAQEIAIKKHPRITGAELLALASHQVTREARSAYFPTAAFNATAAGNLDEDNTRIAAGGLNNSIIYQRNAEGVVISQLLTDFGRTANLTENAKLEEHAQEAGALATRAEILLEVDNAYFSALQAQMVVEVATQTVATRQLTFDQVNTLAQNKLKSGLDVSFAKVNLDEANLLLANASNDLSASFASLVTLLGEPQAQIYGLAKEPVTYRPQTNAPDLVEAALARRPELAQLRFERDAALRLARAEKDLNYPTISAVATGGLIPVHDSHLENNYAAAGVNLNLPIFDGMLYSAKEKEAEFRARAAAEDLRNEENNIIRDVRIAVLNLNYAAERVTLTEQLLDSANEALDLAQARYKVGSSSIVELSQAQLNQTQAQIDQARAKYQYQIQNAVLNFQVGQLQ